MSRFLPKHHLLSTVTVRLPLGSGRWTSISAIFTYNFPVNEKNTQVQDCG